MPRQKTGTFAVTHWTEKPPREGDFQPCDTSGTTLEITVSGHLSIERIQAVAQALGMPRAALTIASDPPGLFVALFGPKP